ncbi:MULTISPECIES: hypothetical protein [unclassified Acidovorax]|uniref:hypothetical protein n=1 Tax=unclassified Acidovorax TaxID=2684926 RepID=UPI0028832501|nr:MULTISPECIES: hypothetical protein [unclassified Acidovorax]
MHYNVIPTRPHSGLGIASLVISVTAGAALAVLLGIASVIESQPGGMDEESAGAVVLGLFLALTAVVQALALGLGIAALVQAERSELFGVLGTVFASSGLIATVLIFLLGALLES